MEPETDPTSDAGEPTPEIKVHEIGQKTFIVADVDPLDVDGVRTTSVIAGLWLVAFVMLLPFYGSLKDNDRVWWLWTCVAGFGLGMFGVEYCRRRRRRRQARER